MTPEETPRPLPTVLTTLPLGLWGTLLPATPAAAPPPVVGGVVVDATDTGSPLLLGGLLLRAAAPFPAEPQRLRRNKTNASNRCNYSKYMMV